MTQFVFIELAKEGVKFQTKCGFEVKIYSASTDNACAWIHGAVYVPHHPATFGGWTSTEWNPQDGNNSNEHWNLVKHDHS